MLQMKPRRFGGSHLCTFKSAPGAGQTTTQQLAPSSTTSTNPYPKFPGQTKQELCLRQTAKNKSIVGKKNTAGRYGEAEDLKMSTSQLAPGP